MSEAELARNRTLGSVWLVVVCFFNTVPLLIISVLANLDSVSYHDLSRLIDVIEQNRI